MHTSLCGVGCNQTATTISLNVLRNEVKKNVAKPLRKAAVISRCRSRENRVCHQK